MPTFHRAVPRNTPKSILLTGVMLLGISHVLFSQGCTGEPETFEQIEDHFKYGSIGSDNVDRGLPYWIMRVLPDMFPQHLPNNGKGGYESLGMIMEPGMDRPIGFSKRRILLFDVLGLNCAFCHTARIRSTADATTSQTILGMPGSVDVEGFFTFLFKSVHEKEFTAENVLSHIPDGEMGLIKRLLYPFILDMFRDGVKDLEKQFSFLQEMTDFGPGRVETWAPYKTLLFHWSVTKDDPFGLADFPSIWNQQIRQGMHLHWDGNNVKLTERNTIAAVGAGVNPQSIELESLRRIQDWITILPAPRYVDYAPEPQKHPHVNKDYRIIDQTLADQGKTLYDTYCADCHALDGKRTGKIEPLDEVGTDPNRRDSFTPELAQRLNEEGKRYPEPFTSFISTNGYTNTPLDGIWLRAPYLHNGSVPTLRDLLNDPKERPETFYRGYNVYDWEHLGFRSDVPEENGRKYFLYKTKEKGNGNGGHVYGTQLRQEEKEALIEYLKML